MAFKMKGFSGFKKNGKNGKRGYDTDNYEKREEEQQRIAKNQDPPSGRNQVDELKYDMKHAQEQIDKAKKALKNNPHKKGTKEYNKHMTDNNRRLTMITRGLNMQKKDYLRYLSRKGMLPK